MKRTAAIGNTIFIYLIALLPLLLFAGGKSKIITFVWKHLFHNNIFVPLGFILLFGIIMYIANIVFLWNARHGKWSAKELARTNMIVKLIQIPAYFVIFVIGLLCTIMIFTIGISFALILLDAFSIGMTGLFASAAFHNLRKEQLISKEMWLLYSIASFIFCVDIVIAIIGYRISTSDK